MHGFTCQCENVSFYTVKDEKMLDKYKLGLPSWVCDQCRYTGLHASEGLAP